MEIWRVGAVGGKCPGKEVERYAGEEEEEGGGRMMVAWL